MKLELAVFLALFFFLVLLVLFIFRFSNVLIPFIALVLALPFFIATNYGIFSRALTIWYVIVF